MPAAPAQPARRHSRDSRGFLPLVGPLWLVLGGLVLLPLVGVVVLSFAAPDGQGGYVAIESLDQLWAHVASGAFLDSYRAAWEPRMAAVAWRSLWLAVVTTALTALVAYPLAYYLAVRSPPRWRPLLVLLAVVPFWTSFLIRTFAWFAILGRQGLLNTVLVDWGVLSGPADLLYNEWAVLVGLVYGELPFMVLPVYASLERLDRSLLEASADAGAGRWATFRRVTLPLSAPGLAAGAVLVFVPSVGQFVVSDLLGGAKARLLGNEIQDQFTGGTSAYPNPPLAAALSVQVTAAVLLLAWMYARWARRRGGAELV